MLKLLHKVQECCTCLNSDFLVLSIGIKGDIIQLHKEECKYCANILQCCTVIWTVGYFVL